MPDDLFDPDGFIAAMSEAFGDEGQALGENLARNLTEGVRQPRNRLEAKVFHRPTRPELSDATDLEPSAQTARNTQASFEGHLRAAFRRAGDRIGEQLRAQEWLVVQTAPPADTPVAAPPRARVRLLSRDEYAAEGQANLSRHPHSKDVALPIPGEYSDLADQARQLVGLTPKQQAEWIAAELVKAAKSTE